MNDELHLRPASNEDQKAIEELVFPILRSFGLEPAPDSTDADLADIRNTYFENGGFFDVLVDREDRILGTIAIHRTDEDLCELRKMYLSPALRGHGWGRRLLEYALNWATEAGFGNVWLETAESLKTAHRLYEGYGFVPFEGPHCSARCDFAMVKPLR